MQNEKLVLRAKNILARYPKADAVYFTSDGSPFVNERDASQHAKSLSDKTITPITQTDVASVGNEGEKKDNEGGKEGKVEVTKPYSKMNLTELQEAAKAKKIEVAEGATKDQIREQLKAAEVAAVAQPSVDENKAEGEGAE